MPFCIRKNDIHQLYRSYSKILQFQPLPQIIREKIGDGVWGPLRRGNDPRTIHALVGMEQEDKGFIGDPGFKEEGFL